MVYFRKRLTPEILGEINEMIISNTEPEDDSNSDNKPNPPSNNGTIIVDATVPHHKSSIRRIQSF